MGKVQALVTLLETFLPENENLASETASIERFIAKRMDRIKVIFSYESKYWMRYIKSSVSESIRWKIRRLKWKICEFLFTSRNRSLPSFLHDVTWLDDIALRNYQLINYAGKLNFIYAGDESETAYNRPAWNAIADQGVNVFIVPHACTHNDIINFNHPQAQLIVDQLELLIEQAIAKR